MIIRIPLDDTNSKVSYRYPEADDEVTKAPATEISPMPSPEFGNLALTLLPGTVPTYVSSHYSYPVTDINVTVPDGDKPVVAAWFGNSSGSVTPSDTLVKRLTSAVIGAMTTFFGDASRIGLFTRPFRLGYALLSKDGKLIAVQSPRLVQPNDRAPVMAIRSSNPNGDLLQTLTEIRNHPYELRVTLPAFTLPEELLSEVAEVVFYITDQVSPLTGDEQVTGVRTYVIDSANCPGWYYPRLSADTVAEKAMRDGTFRIIGRVPIATALNGISNYRLPDNALDLTDFKSYPEAKDVSTGTTPADPSTDPDPERPEPIGIDVETFALDLGLSEENKRIRAVTARGIFSRHPDNATITLYGAHHLPADQLGAAGAGSEANKSADYGEWKKIARARGPHIRLLRGLRYRWLRVQVSTPWPARIDALTFTLTTNNL